MLVCDAVIGRILHTNSLEGTIPAELGGLTSLFVFLEVLSVPGVPLLNNGLALRCPHLLDS